MAVFDCQDDSARLRTQRIQTRCPTLVGLFERLVSPHEGPAPPPQGDLTVGHIFYFRGAWGMLGLAHPTATPSPTR